MKNTTANIIRERYLSAIMSYFTDEDIGKIASNSFNFPIVEDGEEGWIEIVVKIPKDDEGYAKREEYTMKCKERIDKAKANAEAKAKKIERDKKSREERKRKKEEEKGE